MHVQPSETPHLVALVVVGLLYVGVAIHDDGQGEIRLWGVPLREERHPWIFRGVTLVRLFLGASILLFCLWRFARGPFPHP